MAGRPKRVEDDQGKRLKALLAQANARYRTLTKNRETINEASRCFDQILELEKQLTLLEQRAPESVQPEAARPGRCRQCGATTDINLVLRFEDSDPNNPESTKTRRLTEQEFLGVMLGRQGWRMPLVEVLNHMLHCSETPLAVRKAAADFLGVLSEEDRDGRLGELTNGSQEDLGESETEDGDGGDRAS